MKLSIVVPVYNAERWLRRCVESLLEQDIDKDGYEILLVDDGSKDGSLAVANDLATTHSNIRVFTQPNAGPGAARNRGISDAKGQYIMFVDADDHIKPNSIGKVLATATNENLDLCFFQMLVITPSHNFIGGYKAITNRICNGEYIIRHKTSIGSACSCLLSAKLLHTDNIRFTSIHHGEDTLFMTEAIACASKIKFLPDTAIYIYDCTRSTTPADLLDTRRGKLIDSIFIAQQTHEIARKKRHGPPLSGLLHQLANSIVVPQIINALWHRKEYGAEFTTLFFRKLLELKAYPIKGTTLSWRTTLLIPILNILNIPNMILKDHD